MPYMPKFTRAPHFPRGNRDQGSPPDSRTNPTKLQRICDSLMITQDGLQRCQEGLHSDVQRLEQQISQTEHRMSILRDKCLSLPKHELALKKHVQNIERIEKMIVPYKNIHMVQADDIIQMVRIAYHFPGPKLMTSAQLPIPPWVRQYIIGRDMTITELLLKLIPSQKNKSFTRELINQLNMLVGHFRRGFSPMPGVGLSDFFYYDLTVQKSSPKSALEMHMSVTEALTTPFLAKVYVHEGKRLLSINCYATFIKPEEAFGEVYYPRVADYTGSIWGQYDPTVTRQFTEFLCSPLEGTDYFQTYEDPSLLVYRSTPTYSEDVPMDEQVHQAEAQHQQPRPNTPLPDIPGFGQQKNCTDGYPIPVFISNTTNNNNDPMLHGEPMIDITTPPPGFLIKEEPQDSPIDCSATDKIIDLSKSPSQRTRDDSGNDSVNNDDLLTRIDSSDSRLQHLIDNNNYDLTTEEADKILMEELSLAVV